MAKKKKNTIGFLIDTHHYGCKKRVTSAFYLSSGICSEISVFGTELEKEDLDTIFDQENLESLASIVDHDVRSEQEDHDYVLLFNSDLSYSNYKRIKSLFPYPIFDNSILLYNFLLRGKKNEAFSLCLMKFYDALSELDRRRNLKKIPQKEIDINFEEHSDVNDQIRDVFSKREAKFEKAYNSGLPIISVLGAGLTAKHALRYLLSHFQMPRKQIRFSYAFDTKIELINDYQYPNFYLHNALPFPTNESTFYEKACEPLYSEMGYASLYVVVVDADESDFDYRLKNYDSYIKSVAKRKDYKIIHILDENDNVESKLSRMPRENEYVSDIKDGQDIDGLLSFIFSSIYESWKEVTLLLPYEMDIYTFRKENYVTSLQETKNGHLITCRINPLYFDKYKDYIL